MIQFLEVLFALIYYSFIHLGLDLERAPQYHFTVSELQGKKGQSSYNLEAFEFTG